MLEDQFFTDDLEEPRYTALRSCVITNNTGVVAIINPQKKKTREKNVGTRRQGRIKLIKTSKHGEIVKWKTKRKVYNRG